jgi:glycosyltransferase A (GT-A) superfamily protein (DUF2064 family)
MSGLGYGIFTRSKEPGITKTDIVKAIGNSVSCGVAEALVLAWYSQNEDISGFFEGEEVKVA